MPLCFNQQRTKTIPLTGECDVRDKPQVSHPELELQSPGLIQIIPDYQLYTHGCLCLSCRLGYFKHTYSHTWSLHECPRAVQTPPSLRVSSGGVTARERAFLSKRHPQDSQALTLTHALTLVQSDQKYHLHGGCFSAALTSAQIRPKGGARCQHHTHRSSFPRLTDSNIINYV